MANERYPLRQIVVEDLLNHNKIALFLLICIVASAIATIWLTHQTRLLTAEQGKLVQANRKLENQYVHLQLEENTKGRRTRVEQMATQFGLQPIKKEQEVILVH